MPIRHSVSRLATSLAALTGLLALVSGVLLATQVSSSASIEQTVRPVLVDCSHHDVRTPRTYTITCGDANIALMRTHWRTWGANAAAGTARYVENNCDPDCADGRFVHYRVHVTADRTRMRAGVPTYTRIVVRFAKHHPAWVKHHRAVFDVSVG